MAWTVPTAANFKARYPKFSAVGDATIDIILAEGARYVDDSWPTQAHFTNGRFLYTAWALMQDGHGSNGDAAAAGLGSYGEGVKRLKSGDTEIEWATGSGGSAGGGSVAGSELQSNSYGKSLYSLMRQLFGGPRVIQSVPGFNDTGYPG